LAAIVTNRGDRDAAMEEDGYFPLELPMKKVCISIVGSGQLHEVTIEPGTTAGDILSKLNLSDYLLSSNPSADFFAASESVYEKVADGQKLFASTKATVGTNFLGRLRDTVLKYWQEHRWSKSGNVYRGNYQTPYGAFQGFIEERSGRNISCYILQPPRQVLNSSHGPCFQPSKDGWFHVHMSSRPRDISSAIVAIERLISDCFRNGR
jgi:hypothetical protein